MLIFMSGSVNSGKTTTSKVVAKKLGFVWFDLDTLRSRFPDFALEEVERDIPKLIQLAIVEMNQLHEQGKSIVANFVLRPQDHVMLEAGLSIPERVYVTLAPSLAIAQSNRGRDLSEWEYHRVKYHYDTGIASPNFGHILDTSSMSLDQAAQAVIDITRRSQ